eukprot:121433-Pelagomonas_calceolata.AAC.2
MSRLHCKWKGSDIQMVQNEVRLAWHNVHMFQRGAMRHTHAICSAWHHTARSRGTLVCKEGTPLAQIQVPRA